MQRRGSGRDGSLPCRRNPPTGGAAGGCARFRRVPDAALRVMRLCPAGGCRLADRSDGLMARWGCRGCSAAYGAWLSRCPRCGSAKELVVALNACTGCTTKFAVGLPRCPHCGSTDFTEDWQMPKISAHGGPSSTTAAPGEPGHMPPGTPEPIGAVTPVGEHGPEIKLPFGVTEDADETEVGESSSPGSSSSASSEKPPATPETSSSDPQPPARMTASRSKRARTGSSSAPSTAGDQTAPTSDEDATQ